MKPRLNERLAWCAGIIDGEGHIAAARNNGKDGKYLGLHVIVKMCDKSAVETIYQIAGVGSLKRQRSYGSNRRPLWEWNTSSQEAATFLRRVLPYLVTKHPQAVLFIELAEEQHGRRNRRLTYQRRRFQDSRIRRMAALRRIS